MKKLLIVPVIAFFALAQEAERQPRAEAQPYVTLAGAHSHVDATEYARITTQKDLAAVWLRHMGIDPDQPYSPFHNKAGVPLVDFERCMVVAVFAGKTINAVGVYPFSVTEDERQVVLRFIVRGYQSGPEGDKVSPFGFFVLPRSSKTLVLAQGAYTLDGAPPRWTERRRFPAKNR